MTVGDATPDLTLLFDVPASVGKARLADGRELDRFEREKAEFFERVREAYLQRAREEPGRFRVIDATRSPAAIAQELDAIAKLL